MYNDSVETLQVTFHAKCIEYSTTHATFVDSKTLHAKSLRTIQEYF